MSKKIAVSTLNASTLDIMNVIRKNAPYEYQNSVPKVTKATDIPKVGEIIVGTPALANYYINALINRIALVQVRSSIFNNPYARLKKGFLEFGETIEDIFLEIARVVDYNPEKASSRELSRYIPQVMSAFYVINWKVMYPVTIDDDSLAQAFLSMESMQDFIANIVTTVYKGAEYDEFLLFKYLIIKNASHGKIGGTALTNPASTDYAVAFRGLSNKFLFLSRNYNSSGVRNNAPRNKQVIFMDAEFNAKFDVDVLASAFNMNKANFMGSLFLIDKFDEFDNDRWSEIRTESTGLEEVTTAELALMKNVKAIIFDENWFQVYDNKDKFTEKYVASGPYWNYFYHVWKTVAASPFANAVLISNTAISAPAKITAKIVSKDMSEDAVVFGVELSVDGATLSPNDARLLQTQALTTAGIGVEPYGAIYIPASQVATSITLEAACAGKTYTNTTAAGNITSANEVGDSVELTVPTS